MVGEGWIVQLMARAIVSYVPSGQENSLCTTHGHLYSWHLTNLTYWAVQMLDSRSTGMSGYLSGNRHDFGNLDQCIGIKVPDLGITGRYMVLKLEFSPQPKLYSAFDTELESVYKVPDPKNSVWADLKPTKDPRINSANELNWAICVPASCEPEDVKNSLSVQLMPLLDAHGIVGNLSISNKYTYSKDDPPKQLPTGYHAFLFFTYTLIVAVLLMTICDLWQGTNIDTDRRAWYYNFSMVTNMNKLLKVQSSEFASISGMKVISMFLIIYGHRMMISSCSLLINQRENELARGDLQNTYIKNGVLVVNTFLVITGFLTYYKILKAIDKNNSINAFMLIIRRWLRLTPAYAFVMCFVVYVLPQLDTGPIGRGVIWQSACKDYWWANILYLNNYILPDKQCLIPSWYLATDLQLYVLCTFLGFVLYKWRTPGLILLAVVGILSVVLPGLIVLRGHYSGIALFYLRNFDHYFGDTAFVETYMHSHARASPYIIGMISAYAYYVMEKKNFFFSNMTLWIIFIMMSVVMNVSILGACIFYIPGRKYELWENVAYSSLHSVGWAVPVSAAIIIDARNAFAPVRKTVGLKIFQSLNGLTYSALLVHTLLQLYITGLARTPLYYTFFISVWMGLGDVAMSYIIALLLYLFVEAPFAGLQNFVFDLNTALLKPKQQISSATDNKNHNVTTLNIFK